MKFSFVDIGAAGVVITLLLLPPPVRRLEETYTGPSAKWLPRIAEAQAEVARHPTSGEAAAGLSEVLMWAGQSDWALRAAGVAGSAKSTDRWRALWALSKVHAQRIEVDPAFRWARQARIACDEPATSCTERDKMYLDLRVAALDACISSGIDPRVESKGCEDAVIDVLRPVKAPKQKKPSPPAKAAPAQPEQPQPANP